MFDKEFLKTLTIMYAEDDDSIRDSLGTIFKKVFKDVVLCTDGQDGLNKYKEYYEDNNKHIDAIVSDINMPRMSGLQMLSEIRKFDTEIPAILTTAHGETDFLMEAIRVNVLHYALKPIDTPELLKNIQKFCLANHQKSLLKRKEEELRSYIDIIDQVAAIAKVDEHGNFIEVNDLFCDVSLFDKEELLSKNMLDITHKDTISKTHNNMYNKILSGETWEGLYKCVDKDEDTFFLRIHAIPDFDDTTDELIGTMFIGFIATADEKEKKDTMAKVRFNIIEQKKKAMQLQGKIKQLEATQSSVDITKIKNEYKAMQTVVEKYKIKNVKLLHQINHHEDTILSLRNKLDGIAKSELLKRQNLMEKSKNLQVENSTLKETLIHTKNQLTKLEKRTK